jgi:hypothetical protein
MEPWLGYQHDVTRSADEKKSAKALGLRNGVEMD